MFGFLDGRIIDVYSLQNTLVVQNADGTTYDVVARNLPEDEQILKNFPSKADAEAFVKKVQDGLVELEGIAIIDLRS